MNLVPAIARRWPFANGSGRIIDRYARNIDLGSGERRVSTSDNFPITVLENDLIGRHIILTGKFDRSIIQVLLDCAHPGDILVDVGANIGYVSACFLANVPGSRVICVEPQPGIVELLRRNLGEFESRRSEVHETALSDRDGELCFHVDPLNRGASRISADGETSVPVMEAAKLFRSFARIDLLKIDVEGHELPIFRSIAGELDRLRPRAILFEDHACSAELRSILEAVGYRVAAIEKQLFRTRLSPQGRANDFLAVID
jgi:FkbM family methyltransferase